MVTNKGIIYIAFNSQLHYDEAIKSASTVLEHNPDTSITLLTDSNKRVLEGIDYKQFRSPTYHSLKEKCRIMRESPYDKTIFLDTDTRIMGDVSPIFNYLDNYDIAIANAPNVDRDKERGSDEFFINWKIPEIYNTGVIGFRNNKSVNQLFKMWWNKFKKIPDSKISTGHGDQIYFNKLLSDDSVDTSFVDIKVMDNKKYNARSPIVPYLIEENLDGEIIIYHGHKSFGDYY